METLKVSWKGWFCLAKHIYMTFLASKYRTDVYMYTPDPVIISVNRESQLILFGISLSGKEVLPHILEMDNIMKIIYLNQRFLLMNE